MKARSLQSRRGVQLLGCHPHLPQFPTQGSLPLWASDKPPKGLSPSRRFAKVFNCLKTGAGTQGWKLFLRLRLGEHGAVLPHQPSPQEEFHSYSIFLSL